MNQLMKKSNVKYFICPAEGGVPVIFGYKAIRLPDLQLQDDKLQEVQLLRKWPYFGILLKEGFLIGFAYVLVHKNNNFNPRSKKW